MEAVMKTHPRFAYAVRVATYMFDLKSGKYKYRILSVRSKSYLQIIVQSVIAVLEPKFEADTEKLVLRV